MNRIISSLRLIRLISSRRFAKEIVFLAEIVLMVVMTAIVSVQINNTAVIVGSLEDTIEDCESLVYYSQGAGANKTMTCDILAKGTGEYEAIYRSEHRSMKTEDGSKVALIVLCEELLRGSDMTVSSGNVQEGMAVISPHLSRYYRIGQSIELSDGKESISLNVCAVLDTYSTIPDIHYGTGIGCLGTFLGEYRDMDVIVTSENAAISLLSVSDELTGAAIKLKPGDDPEETAARLNREYSDYGNFYSYEQLKKRYKDGIFDALVMEKIFLLLTAITAVFSLIGYTIVNIRQKQHLCAIMNICGLSQIKQNVITTAYMFLITCPALAIGLYLSPKALVKLNIPFYGYSSFVVAAIIISVTISVTAGLVVSATMRRQTSILTRYKE